MPPTAPLAAPRLPDVHQYETGQDDRWPLAVAIPFILTLSLLCWTGVIYAARLLAKTLLG